MRIQGPSIELQPAAKPDAARIDQVARQFEGQFAQMLVKSMRDASFGDALFPGENQMFRDLYDQQLSKALTEGKGLGLAPMIARQLSAASAVDTAADANAATAADGHAFELIAGGDGSGSAGEAQSGLDVLVSRLLSRRADAYRGTAGAVSGSDPAAAAAGQAAAESFTAGSPERFVAGIWQHARQAAQELGVDARALVAQAALETGWGRRTIQRGGGDSAHNLFGIKANGWSGERVNANTHEYVDGAKRNERADFRAYASAGESFADYVRLLKSNPRYRQALQAGTNIRGFAQGLQRAGYATDPAYASKIAAIAGGPTIDRAVAAIGNAAADLQRRYASNAGPNLAGATR